MVTGLSVSWLNPPILSLVKSYLFWGFAINIENMKSGDIKNICVPQEYQLS